MIKRNRKISKKRYIRFKPVGLPGRRVEQYFGSSHLNHGFQLDSVPEGDYAPEGRAYIYLGERIPGEVHGDDEEHLGCDVQTDLSRGM